MLMWSESLKSICGTSSLSKRPFAIALYMDNFCIITMLAFGRAGGWYGSSNSICIASTEFGTNVDLRRRFLATDVGL